MKFWHRHAWEEVGRFTRARAIGATEFKTGSYSNQEAKDRDVHGFTTVELRCSGCGDVTARYLLGRRP